MAIFSTFFFRQYRPRNCLLWYSRDKKRLSKLSKQQFENSQKIDIFPKGLIYGFGPKMIIFPTFFLGNIGQENVIYHILQREHAFQGYKKKKFKKSKKWHFSKGVNPWFLSKNGNFSNFFLLGNIRQENVCYDTLERKKRLSRL